jgi:hypothetical protein
MIVRFVRNEKADSEKQNALKRSYVLLMGTRFVDKRYSKAAPRVTWMGRLWQSWSVSADVVRDILLHTRARFQESL